jgi:hypothetical protein
MHPERPAQGEDDSRRQQVGDSVAPERQARSQNEERRSDRRPKKIVPTASEVVSRLLPRSSRSVGTTAGSIERAALS